jgi:hypothetical protein
MRKLSPALIPLALALLTACPAEEKTEAKDETKAEAEEAAAAPGHEHAGHDTAAGTKAAPGDAAKKRVFFRMPLDGTKTYSPVRVAMGVEGLGIRPAGEDPKDQTTGHHHIIVDGEPVPAGTAVPADATHIHFGKGQTHTQLELAPGKHKLTLQLADGAHLSYGPELSTSVEVEVLPPPEKKPRVFFVEPAAGAKVKSPVKIVFGIEGMAVRPAGEDPKDHTSGHHHLVIDGKPIPGGTAVPADATHIHFGKGQTETTQELAPGKHKLMMQLADGSHLSYGPDLSAEIEVEVE